MYLAIRLHFQSPNYDFVKYNGEIKCTKESFMKRNDRYFFHKLSKRYNRPEYQDFLVSNFVTEDSVNPMLLTQASRTDSPLSIRIAPFPLILTGPSGVSNTQLSIPIKLIH